MQDQNQKIFVYPDQISLLFETDEVLKRPDPQAALHQNHSRAWRFWWRGRFCFWIMSLGLSPWSSTEVLCGLSRTEECRFTARTKLRTLPDRSRSLLEVRGWVSARRAAVSLWGSTRAGCQPLDVYWPHRNPVFWFSAGPGPLGAPLRGFRTSWEPNG